MTACPECGRDFSNYGGMRAHLRQVHPESFTRSTCTWDGCRALARSEEGLCPRHAVARREGYRYDTHAADLWLGLNASERRRLHRSRFGRRKPRRNPPLEFDEETVRRLVHQSTSTQGLPEQIEDAGTIHRVASLLKKGIK